MDVESEIESDTGVVSDVSESGSEADEDITPSLLSEERKEELRNKMAEIRSKQEEKFNNRLSARVRKAPPPRLEPPVEEPKAVKKHTPKPVATKPPTSIEDEGEGL